MKKTYNINVYEKKIVSKEIDLPETNQYVHFWNRRLLLAIIPEKYEYNDGKIVGYDYHCYLAQYGDIQYLNVTDIALADHQKSISPTTLDRIYDVLIMDTGYDGRMEKDEFIELYNKMRDQTKIKIY